MKIGNQKKKKKILNDDTFKNTSVTEEIYHFHAEAHTAIRVIELTLFSTTSLQFVL